MEYYSAIKKKEIMPFAAAWIHLEIITLREVSQREKKKKKPLSFTFVQFSSVAQSYPTLCDPMNCTTPGLPIHHQLPESTQTHVH